MSCASSRRLVSPRHSTLRHNTRRGARPPRVFARRAPSLVGCLRPRTRRRALPARAPARSARLLRVHERLSSSVRRRSTSSRRVTSALQSGRRLIAMEATFSELARAPGAHRRHAVLRRSLLHPLPQEFWHASEEVRGRGDEACAANVRTDTADGWSPPTAYSLPSARPSSTILDRRSSSTTAAIA